MTLQSSGLITLSDIQDEFGGVNPISLSEYYRLAGYTSSNNTNVPTSGEIKFSNFYNGVRQFVFSITNDTKEADLYAIAVSEGWNEVDPINLTIVQGVYVWSDSITTAGLTINNIPSGSVITNYGYIMGRGGNGGSNTSAGQNGGPALINNSSGVSLINASGAYIAGGGGGGGGGVGAGKYCGGGGGAGGGVGGDGGDGVAGAAGAVGLQATDGTTPRRGAAGFGGGGGGGYEWGARQGGAGGSGGRVFGGIDVRNDCSNPAWNGINTCWPAAYGRGDNSDGEDTTDGGGAGGGGGWGAAGGRGGQDGDTSTATTFSAGGAGGAAISGTAVTLTNNGTIYGAVA